MPRGLSQGKDRERTQTDLSPRKRRIRRLLASAQRVFSLSLPRGQDLSPSALLCDNTQEGLLPGSPPEPHCPTGSCVRAASRSCGHERSLIIDWLVAGVAGLSLPVMGTWDPKPHPTSQGWCLRTASPTLSPPLCVSLLGCPGRPKASRKAGHCRGDCPEVGDKDQMKSPLPTEKMN